MAQPDVPSSSNTSFDARWAEWIALGARRERESARRFRIALPILAVLAAGGLYLVVG